MKTNYNAVTSYILMSVKYTHIIFLRQNKGIASHIHWALSHQLVAGECYELHFVVKAYRTSGGYDYNDVQPRSLIKGGKDLLQQ